MKAQMHFGGVRITAGRVGIATAVEIPATRAPGGGGAAHAGNSANIRNATPVIDISRPLVGAHVHRTQLHHSVVVQVIPWQRCGGRDATGCENVRTVHQQAKASESDVGAFLSVELGKRSPKVSLEAGATGLQVRREATAGDMMQKVKLASSSSGHANRNSTNPSGSEQPPGCGSCRRFPESQLTVSSTSGPSANIPATNGNMNICAEYLRDAEPPDYDMCLQASGSQVMLPQAAEPRLSLPSATDVGAHVSIGAGFQTGKLSLDAGAGGLKVHREAAIGDVEREVRVTPSSSNARSCAEYFGNEAPPDYDMCLQASGSRVTMPHTMEPRLSLPAAADVGAHVSIGAGFQTGKLSLDAGAGGLKVRREAAIGDVEREVRVTPSSIAAKATVERCGRGGGR